MKTEVDIRINYVINDTEKNMEKADEIYKSFQAQFEKTFPTHKLKAVHISKCEVEEKKK